MHADPQAELEVTPARTKPSPTKTPVPFRDLESALHRVATREEGVIKAAIRITEL
jgi:hypothetical protein